MADSPRARAGDGRESAVAPSLMARLTGMIAGAKAGFTGTWFPPGLPLAPIAPDPAAIQGRRFDYQPYINTNYTPRGESDPVSISFAMLRRVAEPAAGGLDLLRLAIETRKDQMVSQTWGIRGRKKNDDGGDVARGLEQILRKPDGALTFRQWMKLVLEDHFVIDAPSIFYRGIAAGTLLEVIDGATLKLLVDDRGRTPLPPLPAYQQIIHGAPATNYTTKELGYYVYNPRPSRIYGMSRVEQVIGIVTLALNRQLSLLSYYTEGNIPDTMMGVPETWTVDQIKDFQTYFDSVLAGQLGERSKMRFVPGGMQPTPLKDKILQDQFDEWLARVICYAFSLSPQALVKEVNRATAETAKETSLEEGLEPTKLWFKDVMDDALLRMGYAELEWGWIDEEIQDPATKAEVVKAYTAGKPVISLDEARAMIGLDPASGDAKAQLEELWAAPDPFGAAGVDEEEPIDSPEGANGAAAKRRGRSLRPSTKLTARTEAGIGRLVHAILSEQLGAVLEALGAETSKAAGPVVTEDDLRAMLRTLERREWNDRAREKLRELLKALSKNRAAEAIRSVKPGDETAATFQEMMNQANSRAIAWAEQRVGNLITAVSNTTRNAVNELTADAISSGDTNDALARRLEDAYEFSEGRSQMIARTETAFADTAGTLSGYRAAGVMAKEWSADELACDVCESLDGEVVPIDEAFSDGSDGPPAHPDCRCTVVPVLPE